MSLNLSKRLQIIASFLPENAYFADIGTDHAYLPCYVCLKDSTAQAIASEVKKGPYNRALQTVNKYGLADKIDVRIGDGLQIIDETTDKIEQLIIAGMGGSLITNILNEGKTKLTSVQRLILQPNVAEHLVRDWLYTHNYAITQEVILEENDHLYEVIVADRSLKQPYATEKECREKQLLFGPLLIEEKSALFYKKWTKQLEHLQRLVLQMEQSEQAKRKKSEFKQQIRWIQEVLKDG